MHVAVNSSARLGLGESPSRFLEGEKCFISWWVVQPEVGPRREFKNRLPGCDHSGSSSFKLLVVLVRKSLRSSQKFENRLLGPTILLFHSRRLSRCSVDGVLV